ncbi:S41 family peptidase [Mucilaginibacter sp. KACC 22063]|uniref:S41 family peptidase n=1 Tax=Mucilaginibacter sp. KACC 22063 TaxID=3025666 RepID=UPI0023673C54|nr:S41 family peptidase [Mucilaginibacter sp. KACC 22063]WDF53851.1 S41 family peptidase [Mucilaginibacter sp. KACC 22063]
MKKTFYIFLLGIAAITGCKKDKAVTPDNTTTNTPPTTGSALDLMRDSVFLYAKEDYYWYDGLPDYNTFKPRSFTGSTDLEALQKEVNALSQYKINPTTGKPYEYYAPDPGEAKYSFIDDGSESKKLNGVTGDFGFAPFFNTNTDLRIKYVYPGSPADLAGIKRGYKITNINGTTSFDATSDSNIDFIINAYSNSSTITMTLQKPDGTTMSANLSTTSYTVNPLFTSTVIDLGNGKKVGYMVFKDFVSLKSAQPKLDAAFSTFTSSGITDLVVDLRYNGGGYVETAEYLDNLIAPASASNKLMYTAYYNSILSNNKDVLLKNQVRKDDNGNTYNYGQIDFSAQANQTNFGSTHGLALNRVFFLVTNSTASASELTINNLRPYMNVQIIGRTTYGKPVGFFDIDINKYEMFIPEFETKNASSQGGYYTGMVPGSSDYPGLSKADDVTRDFGDTNEGLLASALSYIKNGSYTNSVNVSVQSLSTNAISADRQITLSSKMDNDKFKGMFYQHPKHK